MKAATIPLPAILTAASGEITSRLILFISLCLCMYHKMANPEAIPLKMTLSGISLEFLFSVSESRYSYGFLVTGSKYYFLLFMSQAGAANFS